MPIEGGNVFEARAARFDLLIHSQNLIRWPIERNPAQSWRQLASPSTPQIWRNILLRLLFWQALPRKRPQISSPGRSRRGIRGDSGRSEGAWRSLDCDKGRHPGRLNSDFLQLNRPSTLKVKGTAG